MRRVLLTCGVLAIAVEVAWAQASVEERVELPKSRSATVVTKRYEIITKGGVLSPSPPLAVVYLEGSFFQARHLAHETDRPRVNAPNEGLVAGRKVITFSPAKSLGD